MRSDRSTKRFQGSTKSRGNTASKHSRPIRKAREGTKKELRTTSTKRGGNSPYNF